MHKKVISDWQFLYKICATWSAFSHSAIHYINTHTAPQSTIYSPQVKHHTLRHNWVVRKHSQATVSNCKVVHQRNVDCDYFKGYRSAGVRKVRIASNNNRFNYFAYHLLLHQPCLHCKVMTLLRWSVRGESTEKFGIMGLSTIQPNF